MTPPIRTLIVDDELLARQRLRALLGGEPGVAVIGECADGAEAIAAVGREKPDLMLLDIQMSGCSGLEVIKSLPRAGRPAIVVATAHERFALEAFAREVVDYLLKPFDRERLRTALRRVGEHLRTRRAAEFGRRLERLCAGAAAPDRLGARLVVRCDHRLVFLRTDEIVWVEAVGEEVVVHRSEGRLAVREPLAAIAERLGHRRFVRVNPTAIVHVDQVRELEPTFNHDYIAVLRDGTRLPVCRDGWSRLGKLGTAGPFGPPSAERGFG